jgi:hypothetical protein
LDSWKIIAKLTHNVAHTTYKLTTLLLLITQNYR